MPVSIKLRPTKRKLRINASARKIIERAERQLLQDRVWCINKVTEDSNNNGNNNKARLASLVTRSDLERCDSFIEKVREERFNWVKQRQVRKSQSLFNRNSQDYSYSNNRDLVDNRTSTRDNAVRSDLRNQSNNNNNQLEVGTYNSKWVINLSKTKLTQAQESLLAKGPNFAISPVNIPNVDYITAIE